MANNIKIKRSETPSNIPSLSYGEMGVNISDKKIYVGNSSNNPVLIVDGNAASGGGIDPVISGMIF